MKPEINHRATHALTLVDVLVVFAVATIFVALLLPSLPRHNHRKAPRSRCVSNLKQIGLAARIYSNDHNDRFPWQVPKSETGSLEYANSPEVYRHLLALSNELTTPRLLVCPADNARSYAPTFASLEDKNISYFLGTDAREDKPNEILSGDRNVSGATILNGIMTIATGTNALSWTTSIHVNAGNIALADGSVQQVTTPALRHQLSNSTHVTIRWAIP